jgi:hypothetical protein
MPINEWALLETTWHEGSLALLVRLTTTDDH